MTRMHLQYWMVLPLVAFLGCGGKSGGKPGADMSMGGADLATPADDLSGAAGGNAGGGGSGGGGSLGTDGGEEGDGGLSVNGANVVPVIVDNGPMDIGSADVPFISVTICVPGTTTCTTVDHISVDTGSTGLRIIASALPAGFTLPQTMAAGGNPLAECFTFEDGFVWGSVRNADVKIGGETALNMPLHYVGDPAYPTANIPSDCSTGGGTNESDVASFGGNGILGINQVIADCGDFCTAATLPKGANGGYYSCVGTTCTHIGQPIADQLQNPVSKFPVDNNGAILEMPAVSQSGAATLTGALVFGIGTQSNNALGSAFVVPVDQYGEFTTNYGSAAPMDESFIDSGTSFLSFHDSTIPDCTGQIDFFYCPPTVVNLTAQMVGANNTTTTVGFSVANVNLFDNSFTVFNDLAGDGDPESFDWGFPFFLGRSVYTGFALPANGNGGNGYFAF